MTPVLRPMSTGEILDRTFNLYRNNFALFAGIAILPPALKLIIDLAQLSLSESISGGAVSPASLAGGQVLVSLLLILAYFFGFIVASGATVYAVSMVYLGKSTTIAGSYKGIRPYIGRLIGLFLLMFITFVILGVVLAVPLMVLWGTGAIGLIILVILFGGVALLHLYVCLSVATSVCVVERAGVVNSFSRSMALTKGARGRIWLVFLLTFALNVALSLAIAVPATMVGVTFRSPFLAAIILMLGEFVVSTLIAPILAIPLVLIYYDQRIRKEAFDLQLMMESLGEGPTQVAAAAPIG